MDTTSKGWFGTLWVKMFGEKDEYRRTLDAKAREGAGVSKLAHLVSFVMVIMFSLGSLIALAGSTITSVAHEWNTGQLDIPATISLAVAGLLVLCMDTGMVYAGMMIRMLRSRQADSKDMVLHLVVMIFTGIVEAGTYFYMAVQYEHPMAWGAWVLISARSIAAPCLAIYLTLARPLPVTAKDILNQAELGMGLSLLHQIGDLTSSNRHPLAAQWAMFNAAAQMNGDDRARMERMLGAAEDLQQPGRLRIIESDPDPKGPRGGGGLPHPVSNSLVLAANPALAKAELYLIQHPEARAADIAQALGITELQAKKLVGEVMRAHLKARSDHYLASETARAA